MLSLPEGKHRLNDLFYVVSIAAHHPAFPWRRSFQVGAPWVSGGPGCRMVGSWAAMGGIQTLTGPSVGCVFFFKHPVWNGLLKSQCGLGVCQKGSSRTNPSDLVHVGNWRPNTWFEGLWHVMIIIARWVGGSKDCQEWTTCLGRTTGKIQQLGVMDNNHHRDPWKPGEPLLAPWSRPGVPWNQGASINWRRGTWSADPVDNHLTSGCQHSFLEIVLLRFAQDLLNVWRFVILGFEAVYIHILGNEAMDFVFRAAFFFWFVLRSPGQASQAKWWKTTRFSWWRMDLWPQQKDGIGPTSTICTLIIFIITPEFFRWW